MPVHNKFPILLYHDLASDSLPSEKIGLPTRSTIVQEKAFEEQMRYLKSLSYITLILAGLFTENLSAIQ